jgi:hypothetical protein
MSLTRRRFLETASISSLSLFAGTVMPAAFAKSSQDGGTFSPAGLALLDDASPSTFEPFIGDVFAVNSGARRLGTLTLRSVTVAAPVSKGKNPPAAGGLSNPSPQAVTIFSLRFTGSAARLPQDTYTLEHSALGKFPLFIVPAGPGANPPTCSAIFCLIKPDAGS